jgi:hypothetical protein
MKNIMVFGILALCLSACGIYSSVTVVTGSGKVASEDRDVKDFHAIDISGTGEAVILQGDKEGIHIEAEDNLLPYLETKVDNGVLYIGTKHDGTITSFVPTRPILYKIYVKDLDRFSISGAVKVTSESLTAQSLALNISGTAIVDLKKISAENIDSNVSGTATIHLAGKSGKQTLNLSGLSNYDASDLECDTVILDGSGTSKVVIWVHNTLKMNLSGAANVDYYGNPSVTKEVSGVANIVSHGEK